MFTGLYSSQLRLVSPFLHNLSYKLPVLTEILNDLGYETICYTENPWINKFFRLTRGFNAYFRNCRRLFENLEDTKIFQLLNKFIDKTDFLITKRIKVNVISFYWQFYKLLIRKVFEKIIKNIYWKNWLFETKNTIEILEQYGSKLQSKVNKHPLYLFFNIMASHYPYIPIKKALDFCDFKNRDFKVLKKFLLNIRDAFIKANIRYQPFTKKEVKILTKLYNSCIYYSDLIVGKIISILEISKLLKNSYVIITADHGEHLSSKLDHYYYGHGVDQSAYEPLIRVPLIIYHPNLEKKIINNQVEIKDLFHTILDLTGIPKSQNRYIKEERSIIYQINNKCTPEYIYGEHLKDKRETQIIINQNKKYIKKNQIPRIYNNLYFLRSNHYKYINFENQIEEFYDLIKDPNEQFNIIDKNIKDINNMKSEMKKFIEKINDFNEIEYLITEREKDLLKKNIKRLKIDAKDFLL
jgi:arylsulfatase A-like enzyme